MANTKRKTATKRTARGTTGKEATIPAGTLNMRRVGPRAVAKAIKARGREFWARVEEEMSKALPPARTRYTGDEASTTH